jgi:putative transcriptional regulator
MSEPTHHPTASTLMSFSAGTCDEAFSATIAGHLAFCPVCRAIVQRLDGIGGALLATHDEAPMSDKALDRLLAAADPHAVEHLTHPSLREELPLPLISYFPGGLQGVSWRIACVGVYVADVKLHSDSPSRLKLMRLQSGHRSEEHGHDGQELMLVLTGAYSDGFGTYKVGDIADLGTNSEHAPKGESREDCVCLVAVGGSLSYPSPAARLIAPFLGL